MKRLQALQDSYKDLGVFAQIIDSHNIKAIREAAEKHGVKFPVVVAVKKDWDNAYKVDGVSRTIYYAQQNNRIVWTSTSGLSEAAYSDLASRVKKDLSGQS